MSKFSVLSQREIPNQSSVGTSRFGGSAITASLFLSYSFIDPLFIYAWQLARNPLLFATTALVGAALAHWMLFAPALQKRREEWTSHRELWESSFGRWVGFVLRILLAGYAVFFFAMISYQAAWLTLQWAGRDDGHGDYNIYQLTLVGAGFAAWTAYNGSAGYGLLLKLARFTNKIAILLLACGLAAVWRSLARFPQAPLQPQDLEESASFIVLLVVHLVPLSFMVLIVAHRNPTAARSRLFGLAGAFLPILFSSVVAIGTMAGGVQLLNWDNPDVMSYARAIAPTENESVRTKLWLMTLTLLGPARFVAFYLRQQFDEIVPKHSRLATVALLIAPFAAGVYRIDVLAGMPYRILEFLPLVLLPFLGISVAERFCQWTGIRGTVANIKSQRIVALTVGGVAVAGVFNVWSAVPFPISFVLHFMFGSMDSPSDTLKIPLAFLAPFATWIVHRWSQARSSARP